LSEIVFEGEHYDCADNESVLDCLLRHKIVIAHSCKMGTCQTCLLQSNGFQVPAGARTGLSKNMIAQNYFLSCMYYPEIDISVTKPNAENLFQTATVIEKNKLSNNVLQIIIEPNVPLEYYAGQFINLKQNDNLIRSYSIATDPAKTSLLELHVKRMPNGKMSNWLFDELHCEDEIEFQGPNGLCFYLNTDLDSTVLLIGSGTGLAPLYGIIRSALGQGHRGHLYLYHGARTREELYLHSQLTELSVNTKNFSYIPCLSGDAVSNGVAQGRANDVAFAQHRDLTNWQIFLCGNPQMVKDSQQHAYLAGANLDKIHIDPYNLKDLRKRSRR